MPAQAAYIHGLAQKHTLGKMEGEGGGGGGRRRRSLY